MEVALVICGAILIAVVIICLHDLVQTKMRIPVEMAEINMKKDAVAALKDKIELRLSTEDLKGLFK